MTQEVQELSERVGQKMFEHDAAAKMLGIALQEIAPGYARMTMKVRADMLNGHGILHGGMTFSLADTAFAYACNSKNRKTVALACAITFIAAGREGDELTATASEVSLSGKTGIYDIVVTNQRDEKIAVFRGNSYGTKDKVLE